MAEENRLTGVSSPDTSMYPRFQPMPQPVNPLAQIQQLQSLQLQDQSLKQGQANLGIQRVGAMNSMLGTLITKPDLSINDVTQQLDTMVRNKIISPDEPAAIMQHLAPFANNPEALRGQLRNSYIQTLDHASKMGMGFGQQISRESGAGTQYGSYKPDQPGVVQFPGAVQGPGGTTAPNLPTDATYSENVPYRNPNGQISNLRVTPAQLKGIAEGSLRVDENARIVRVSPAGSPSRAAPAAQGAAMPGTGGGGIAEPPVGAVETQRGLAENATEIEKRIVNSQAEAPQRQADLSTLEADMKKFTTGPYAGMSLAMKRGYLDLRSRLPGGASLPQLFDPREVAAQENFVKTAGLLAQRQFAALGGTGTDSKLESAVKTNPGEALSDMGNQQIVAMLHGNEDAMTARDTALAEWKQKNPGKTADQFQREFNRTYNPRAFQWLRMTPEQRAEMAADMMKNDPQSFKALKKGIDNGVKMGIIPKDSVKVPGE